VGEGVLVGSGIGVSGDGVGSTVDVDSCVGMGVGVLSSSPQATTSRVIMARINSSLFISRSLAFPTIIGFRVHVCNWEWVDCL